MTFAAYPSLYPSTGAWLVVPNERSPVDTRFQGGMYGALNFGGASGIRTPDLRIMIPSL